MKEPKRLLIIVTESDYSLTCRLSVKILLHILVMLIPNFLLVLSKSAPADFKKCKIDRCGYMGHKPCITPSRAGL